MIAVFLTFAAFAAAALAKGLNECSFEDAAETHQCHGVEGQQLIFHLSNKRNSELRLTKDENHRILRRNKNGTVDKYDIWFEDLQNGTFKLGKAMKKHSGEYLLEEYSFTDGKVMKTVKICLNIHAPISKPAVSQTCSSPESTAVTCLSEGEELKFLLTLDGHSLLETKTPSQHFSKSTDGNPRVSSVSINISGQLIGNLVCRVWNNFSRDETAFYLTACKGFNSPVVPITAGAVTLFLFVTLGFIVSKLRTKPSPPPVNEACHINCSSVADDISTLPSVLVRLKPVNEDNSEQVIYTTVNVITDTRKSEAGLQGEAN
ncbi:uncharacterized protein LOC112450684 [Kryptolebias marmoratus]|uniref:uncharacterized protein LOC112450684 n=1 Tax=Kryptolebias marmoratus TaxID=37003 RepID=UPI0018ACD88F|nr:uncharacterized protein LOC112450684 [Kryptolebias marmoratus]